MHRCTAIYLQNQNRKPADDDFCLWPVFGLHLNSLSQSLWLCVRTLSIGPHSLGSACVSCIWSGTLQRNNVMDVKKYLWNMTTRRLELFCFFVFATDMWPLLFTRESFMCSFALQFRVVKCHCYFNEVGPCALAPTLSTGVWSTEVMDQRWFWTGKPHHMTGRASIT